MPAEKKVIAVIGSTGAQGTSVVNAIVKDGEFAVRAITRNTSSDKALALKKLGVELVQADVNDEGALTKAVEGCFGMYCVSFYWQHKNPNLERALIENMAYAAKKAKIQHVVWSTLEDTRKCLEKFNVPTLAENYKVPFFDAKADADHFFLEADVPTTYLMAGFYWDNFIYLGMGPMKRRDGKLAITLPMGKKKLVGIAVEDIGKCALGIFKRCGDYVNKRVGIRSEALTVAEIAEKMSRALKKEIVYGEVSIDEYRQQNKPDAAELANMFQYYRDCEETVMGLRSETEARKLNPELMTFDHWLDRYKEHIPLPE